MFENEAQTVAKYGNLYVVIVHAVSCLGLSIFSLAIDFGVFHPSSYCFDILTKTKKGCRNKCRKLCHVCVTDKMFNINIT